MRFPSGDQATQRTRPEPALPIWVVRGLFPVETIYAGEVGRKEGRLKEGRLEEITWIIGDDWVR